MFFPNDRRAAKEEVAVSPETGMVLLHKHGDDCMLVSLVFLGEDEDILDGGGGFLARR